MGRSSLLVDKKQLTDIISELEAKQTYATRSELWEAVANSDWGKGIRNSRNRVTGISAQMVYNKVVEYSIQVTTAKGKRGGGGPKHRTTRKSKLANTPVLAKTLEQIKKHSPELSDSLLVRYEQGSMTAAMKMRCIRCCGGDPTMYKKCGDTDCESLPFNHLFWPRKAKPNEKQEERNVVELEIPDALD